MTTPADLAGVLEGSGDFEIAGIRVADDGAVFIELVNKQRFLVKALENADAPLSPGQLRSIQTLVKKIGIVKRTERIAYLRTTVGRPEIMTTKDLTLVEAADVIDALEAALAK